MEFAVLMGPNSSIKTCSIISPFGALIGHAHWGRVNWTHESSSLQGSQYGAASSLQIGVSGGCFSARNATRDAVAVLAPGLLMARSSWLGLGLARRGHRGAPRGRSREHN
jgi:hypothetical protein